MYLIIILICVCIIEKDAIKYLEQLERSQTSADVIASDDTKILTVGKFVVTYSVTFFDKVMKYYQ